MRRIALVVLSVLVALAGMSTAAAADEPSIEEKYEFLARKGIFTGFDDGSARLRDPMSREQFAAVLFRLWELEERTGTGKPSYADVLKTRWSFGEIEAVKSAGLMNGIGNDKFGPAMNVTVEQLAAVLVRGYGAAGEEADPVYGGVSRWAEHAVGVALRKNWIPETADYTQDARRSQLVEAAYAVYRDMNPASGDRTKPQLTAHRMNPDASVALTFSEPLDASTALDARNYNFNNDLDIVNLALSDDRRTVTVTTERQTRDTVYRLTVRGVEDAAGNRMDEPIDIYFVAVVDTTPPAVTKVESAKNTVVLTFSEKLDAGSAEQTQSYLIDGGIGLPLRAVYDDAKQTVTLYTTDQTPGQSYTLTILAVRDKAGNVIAPNTQRTFGGAGERPAEYRLGWVTAVNTNTLDIGFSKPLHNVNLSKFKIALKTGKGDPINLSGWEHFAYPKPGSDGDMLTVQFRNAESNPVLFRNDTFYTAEVTGLPGLNEYGDLNEKLFVGFGTANREPYPASVSVLSDNTLAVQFSEPVKNVNPTSFRITDPAGNLVYLDSIDVGSRHDIVTSVKLTTSRTLKAGATYTITFSETITDAPGWNGMGRLRDRYQLTFEGTGSDNEAPRFAFVNVVDRYTLELRFTEPVNGADREAYRIYNETDGIDVPIAKGTAATYTVSPDKWKVTFHLFEGASAPLQVNKVYRLTYREDGDAFITDADGKKLDTANRGGEVRFGGTSRDNDRPRIASVDAMPTVIRVTMSEPVTGFGGQVSFFDVTVGGRSIVPTSGTIEGSVVTLHIPDAKAGEQGTIRISADGENALRDANMQKPAVSDVAFTVK